KLEEAAGFDLPDPFTGDAVAAGDLVERPRLAVLEAEAKLDDLALARRQRTEHLGNPLLEQHLIDVLAGVLRAIVVDHFLERSLGVFAHRLLQAERHARHGPQRTAFVGRDVERLGEIFERRLAPRLAEEFAANALHRGQHADLVARHADRPRMI